MFSPFYCGVNLYGHLTAYLYRLQPIYQLSGERLLPERCSLKYINLLRIACPDVVIASATYVVSTMMAGKAVTDPFAFPVFNNYLCLARIIMRH